MSPCTLVWGAGTLGQSTDEKEKKKAPTIGNTFYFKNLNHSQKKRFRTQNAKNNRASTLRLSFLLVCLFVGGFFFSFWRCLPCFHGLQLPCSQDRFVAANGSRNSFLGKRLIWEQ